MPQAQLDGFEIEYAVDGSGEIVMLVHGATFADGLAQVRIEPSLTKHFRLVSYSRRNYGGSTHSMNPLSIPDQADDCKKLMDYLGIEKAHIVGQSYGGAISLQLTLDHPKMVHTLALLEPGLKSGKLSQVMTDAMRTYQSGDKAGALNAMVTAANGPNGAQMIETMRPGAMAQAVKDLDQHFSVELPARQSWNFTAKEARQIKVPVLSVFGAWSMSMPIFQEIAELMKNWFPQAETLILPNAGHSMQATNLPGLAEGLRNFWNQHPMA
jgi:pimeloyl-ACP methyl ester carboxylesterase